MTGALAKLSESDVAGLAQLDSGGDEHAVDVNARLALELEEHIYGAPVVGTAAQHPSPATENGSCERADEA